MQKISKLLILAFLAACLRAVTYEVTSSALEHVATLVGEHEHILDRQREDWRTLILIIAEKGNSLVFAALSAGHHFAGNSGKRKVLIISNGFSPEQSDIRMLKVHLHKTTIEQADLYASPHIELSANRILDYVLSPLASNCIILTLSTSHLLLPHLASTKTILDHYTRFRSGFGHTSETCFLHSLVPAKACIDEISEICEQKPPPNINIFSLKSYHMLRPSLLRSISSKNTTLVSLAADIKLCTSFVDHHSFSSVALAPPTSIAQPLGAENQQDINEDGKLAPGVHRATHQRAHIKLLAVVVAKGSLRPSIGSLRSIAAEVDKLYVIADKAWAVKHTENKLLSQLLRKENVEYELFPARLQEQLEQRAISAMRSVSFHSYTHVLYTSANIVWDHTALKAVQEHINANHSSGTTWFHPRCSENHTSWHGSTLHTKWDQHSFGSYESMLISRECIPNARGKLKTYCAPRRTEFGCTVCTTPRDQGRHLETAGAPNIFISPSPSWHGLLLESFQFANKITLAAVHCYILLWSSKDIVSLGALSCSRKTWTRASIPAHWTICLAQTYEMSLVQGGFLVDNDKLDGPIDQIIGNNSSALAAKEEWDLIFQELGIYARRLETNSRIRSEAFPYRWSQESGAPSLTDAMTFYQAKAPEIFLIILGNGPNDFLTRPIFGEIAAIISEGLKSLGYASKVLFCGIPSSCDYSPGLNIILAPHLLVHFVNWTKDIAEISSIVPSNSVLYNFEHIPLEAKNLRWQRILMVYSHFRMWDYSKGNVEVLKTRHGVEADYVPLGYARVLEREHIISSSEDIDVLFYGSLNNHRLSMIAKLRAAGIKVFLANTDHLVCCVELDELIGRSKLVLSLRYFLEPHEWKITRFLLPVSNRRIVVSETCGHKDELRLFQEGLVLSTKETLVRDVERFLSSETLRSSKARAAQELVQHMPEENFLREPLEKIFGDQSTRMR